MPGREGLPPYRRVIAGRTRMGKTMYMRYKIIANSPAYIIYDPDEQFSDVGAVTHNYDEFVALLNSGAQRVVFQPTDEIAGQPEMLVLEFDQICQFISQNVRNFQFCIDEISIITKAGGSRVPKCPMWLGVLLKRRMKAPHNIGLVMTTQRMKDADVEFLSQAQESIMFAQNQVDAKYVAEKVGIRTITRPDGSFVHLERALQELPPYTYVKFDHQLRKTFMGRVNLGGEPVVQQAA